eukprot:6399796-Amphidinium_carterae.1
MNSEFLPGLYRLPMTQHGMDFSSFHTSELGILDILRLRMLSIAATDECKCYCQSAANVKRLLLSYGVHPLTPMNRGEQHWLLRFLN